MRSPEANWVLVAEVGSAFARSGSNLKNAPLLLRRLLLDGDWRDFTTPLGKRNRYEFFDQFATTEPPDGLGVPLDVIKRVIIDDAQTLDLLDQACQRPVGRPSAAQIPSIRRSSEVGGTTAAQALRRLRKDAPAVHERVVAGELSPHAGMLEAGLRQKTITIVVTNPESIVRSLRTHLTAEDLARVGHLLAGGD